MGRMEAYPGPEQGMAAVGGRLLGGMQEGGDHPLGDRQEAAFHQLLGGRQEAAFHQPL